MSKFVIIGNGTAAVGCIEGIRSLDKDSSITVISNEIYHTYSRPLISYLLCGKTTLEKMKYRPESFYVDNNVKLIKGKNALKVDNEKKCVVIEENEKIKYDKLLIATGASPFIPPTKGYDDVKHKFAFLSLDDAITLDKHINKSSKVLIIGAGPVGLKCAEGIKDKVSKITVVDMADKVLPAMLDKTSAAIVQKHLGANGINLILNDYVEFFDKNTAHLKSSVVVEFDVLVTCVGVKANTSLLVESGAEIERGIIVNEKSETSVRNIYAAGDCTQCIDITTGESKCLALLPNAYMQAHAAGVNMAGGEEIFDKAIPMNSLGLFGLHIITAGNLKGKEHIISDEKNYKNLVTDNGLLKGFILVGDVNRAGIYTSLIREKIPLNTIDFELIMQKPQLMAFTRKERIKKLSAVQ